jgi:catechol 2,3-dioxygenase
VPGLPAETEIGRVELVVRDLERSISFYEGMLGLELLDRMVDGEASLGAGERPFLMLRGEPEAPPRPPRTTGLFHFAILVPSRAELARSLNRLVERGWRLTGASDHLVSEALYLDDPDGIGIEIYRDRPREEWPHDGDTIRMATLPLDLQGVMAELPEAGAAEGIAAGTKVGHVHLNVADVGDSERFWCDLVGFDVTVRTYPGALFVSAGGYHHHLGLNTWNGPGAPPAPVGAIGLERFEIRTDAGALTATTERLRGAGVEVDAGEGVARARDPAGIAVEIVAADVL